MSYPYDGTDTYPATLTLPEDGDAPDGAAWQTSLEGLADRTTALRKGPWGQAGWQQISLSGAIQPGDGSTDRFHGTVMTGPMPVWRQMSVASAGVLWFSLVPPPGGRVATVQAIVHGNFDAGGNHGGLPATVPTLSVWKRSGGTTMTLLGTATDDSADETEYDASHYIVVSGLTIAAAETESIWVAFTGETGANSEADFLSLLSLEFESVNAP